MRQFRTEELFTIEEVGKYCGMTRNAAYMHYRRGHIKPEPMRAHRLFFTREAIDQFRANYCPFN